MARGGCCCGKAMDPQYIHPVLSWVKRYGLYALYALLLVCFAWLFKRWGLKTLLASLAGFYVLACILAVIGQELVIYYPKRHVGATPAEMGLDFERLQLTTSDGELLHGWFIPGERQQPAVLFCHGNASTVSTASHLKLIDLLHSLGLPVLIFDYRGFGRSSGSPSESGTYRDGEAAWHFLVQSRGYDPGDIVIWGKSLGGGIASYLAARHSGCRALVLESTFTSIPDVARRIVPFLPVGRIIRHTYPVKARVRQVEAPVLVMHSPQDETIPYGMGLEIFAAAGEPKRFVALQGGHEWGFLASREAYREAVREFLRLGG